MNNKNNQQILEGSRAIALTIKNIRPAVISAYPITPQTHIVEDLAKFKADGEANYEYVRAESEFAAASIVLGASAAGVRSYSATSSQGLLLMAEVIYNIAGMRLPVVITCANRAVSAPINIWCFDENANVLMADLTYKPIYKIKIGDRVLGKDKNSNLCFTKVTKIFSRQTENLVKLTTEKFDLTCTPKHLFYLRNSHDHWAKAKNLKNKELHYFGYGYKNNDEFKRGWLAGVADGDGSFYLQGNRLSFRLKAKDFEMVDNFISWANHFSFPLRKTNYLEREGYFIAILTLTKQVKRFQTFLKHNNNSDFARGYLAGMYDSEGTGPHKVKQAVIYNNDKKIINLLSVYLKLLNINFKVYKDTRRGGYYKNDNYHVKINNVPEFFIKCRPIISRKRENLLRMTLKSVKSRLKILNVINIDKKTKVYNLETEVNNYIVNGLLVHNCDQQDIMAIRDAGWILLFAENHQEAVNQHIMAFKLAEQLKLPVMVNVDGFIMTHSYEPVIIPDTEQIKKYLPDYIPEPGQYLDTKNPVTLGALAAPAYYMEIRQELHDDLIYSLKVINDEYKKFNASVILEGAKRPIGSLIDNGLVEYIGPKKPETILTAMGSVVGTIKDTIETSPKIGVLKIKCFRPFPAEQILKIIKPAKNIAVIDKSISLGATGTLASEIKAIAQGKTNANISSFVVGLGGRDITKEIIKKIIKLASKKSDKTQFIGK
ncbi:MAG: LAGLIDADG family homing endonuclease [Candidatus Falkowbacteria bacterium]